MFIRLKYKLKQRIIKNGVLELTVTCVTSIPDLVKTSLFHTYYQKHVKTCCALKITGLSYHVSLQTMHTWKYISIVSTCFTPENKGTRKKHTYNISTTFLSTHTDMAISLPEHWYS